MTARFSCFFFFFSSRRRHTRLQGDWSSDVCSSDLTAQLRNNAVNSLKVANRSLRAIDFAAGQLPAGPAGPAGPGRGGGSPDPRGGGRGTWVLLAHSRRQYAQGNSSPRGDATEAAPDQPT